MSKAKPISLHPLSLDDALQSLIRIDPERVDSGIKPVKSTSKRKPNRKVKLKK